MIYITVLLFLFFGCVKYGSFFYLNYNSVGGRFFYFVEFLLLLSLASLAKADVIGGDGPYYYIYFKDLPTLSQLNWNSLVVGGRAQPFWLYLNAVCKELSSSFYLYLFIHSLIVLLTIFGFALRLGRLRFLFILLYYILVWNYHCWEIQREVLAICAFLWSYRYLEEKKWIMYYLMAGLAFMFHSGALILFVLPFFVYVINKVVESRFPVIIFVIIILLIPLVCKGLLGNLSSIFSFNEHINQQAENYILEHEYTTNGFILRYISIIPSFLVFYLRRKLIEATGIVNCFILIYILFDIVDLYLIEVGRFGNYLFPFYIMAVTQVTDAVSNTGKYKLVLCYFYAWMVVSIIYKYYVVIGPHMRYLNLFNPYVFCFE